MSLLSLVKNFARPNARRVARPQQTKSSIAGPMIAWSGVGQPKWTPRKYENFAEEGFRKNVIAYRCVMQIATASAAIPWLLYDGEGHEVERHPLLGLLQHPNPLQDGVSFLESIYAYLEIAGNAYIEAVTPRDGAAPVELYILRPDRMKVIPGPMGLPQGYQYSVNGQVTNWPADPVTGASNILHLKRFHPLDDWYGMAPMEAALLSIDQHNAAGAWNQALLNQGARPSGALVYAPKDGPNTLTDDQIQRLREELGQLYQGQRSAGRPMILEGGLDWREMSLSPKDMDWLAGRNNAARDIAQAFGVPAQLIGIPDSQTYSNMAEARLAFYEETVLPLVTRVIAGVDHWLTPMFDDRLQLDFDPDSISALTPRRDAMWSKLQNADFLTRNEKREAAGYGPVPGGDEDGDDGSDDPDPASFIPSFDPANDRIAQEAEVEWLKRKFNPYHDELGRFTTGPGSDVQPDDGSDSNTLMSGQEPDGAGGNEGNLRASVELVSNKPDKTPRAWIGQPNEALRDYIANQELPDANKLEGYGYGKENPDTQALGRYQFLNSSLEDIGLKDSNGNWKTDTPFYKAYGIKSDQDFLANPAAQEDVMTAYIARQDQLISPIYRQYAGYHYVGIKGQTITVTESGLIAAFHRAGADNVDDYLDYVQSQGGTGGMTINQLDAVDPLYGPIETRLRDTQSIPYSSFGWPGTIPNPRQHRASTSI